jgi:hypothetical protein
MTDAIFYRSIDTILQLLNTFNLNGSGIELHCADGFIRQGFPIIAAWIADYPEYTCLTKIIGGLCPICEIPRKKMGHEKNSSGQYDPNKYKLNSYPYRCSISYKAKVIAGKKHELYEAGLRSCHNNLWNYPLCNVYSLWNPDKLHLFYIGLVKTLLGNWLLPFLSRGQLRKRFNRRFISVPKYPNLHWFKRFFDEVNSGPWQ